MFAISIPPCEIQLQITVDDSLPKYICTECLDTLKMALAFKKNCEASDRRFRKILNPLGKFNSMYHKIK